MLSLFSTPGLPEKTARLNGKFVLLIEDDHHFQTILSTKLSHLGATVTAIDTIEEAESAISQKVPDLILLDIMLPGGKNGFDLLNALPQLVPQQKIPVIVLTNLTDDESKAAFEMGATSFFIKAETPIQQVLDRVLECCSPHP